MGVAESMTGLMLVVASSLDSFLYLILEWCWNPLLNFLLVLVAGSLLFFANFKHVGDWVEEIILNFDLLITIFQNHYLYGVL